MDSRIKKKTRFEQINQEAIQIADRLQSEAMRQSQFENEPELKFNLEKPQVPEKSPRNVSSIATKPVILSQFDLGIDTSKVESANKQSLLEDQSHTQSQIANDSSVHNRSKASQRSKPSFKSSQIPGPSRESISLVFHYSSQSYKTEKFIEDLKYLARNLQKLFSATMAEFVFMDPFLINLMTDANGAKTRKLKEELGDGAEVLVIRTSIKMPGCTDIDQLVSTNLTTMCNDINQMKFKRRVAFRNCNLLVPITLTFGFETQKLIGSFE